MPTTSTRRVRLLAGVVLVAAIVDLLVLALFHVVQPDVDALGEATSSYVHGTLGVLSPVASVAVGIGALALAAATVLVTTRAGRTVTGAVLLAVFGIAKVAQAFFPIDAAGESTSTGEAHNLLGNLAFFVLPVAVVLVTEPLARASGRGTPMGWPRLAAWLVVGATLAVLAGDALGVFGLVQRVYLVMASLWFALIAVWLLRPRAPWAREAEPAGQRSSTAT